jgi:HdeA/HdeB family
MRFCCLMLAAAILLGPIVPANSDPDSNIAQYKCADFLDDVMQKQDGSRLLRSMMAIAWSTGYAAAYQKDNARADPEAFRLISAMLAADCVKNPDKTVIQTAVQEIHSLFAAPNNNR